jgi:DNA-directed RNA polymerase subunit beta'
MAVHVPLSAEAQSEARFLMLSANNLLAPKDGKPITVPTQDMVLGSYYLTIEKPNEPGEGKIFSDMDEVLMAYDAGELGLHAQMKVRIEREVDGVKQKRLISCTAGRLIFNEAIPQDLGFVDRSDKSKAFDLEVDFIVGKKELGKIIDKCIRAHGTTTTAIILDRIKALGFKFSTKGAITISVSDMVVPAIKKQYLEETEATIDNIVKQFKRGLISDEERYNSVIATWTETGENITKALIDNLDRFNPVFMMSQSGARGNINQIKQLAGMRGLMADTSGKTIEIPIKSNFREGLNVLEFFISTHGARKGLADTALRTADSGYLTRRLVDVSQDVIVRELDCGTDRGIEVYDIKDGSEVIEPLEERLLGRYTTEDFIDPKTQEVIVARGDVIDEKIAKKIVKTGVKKVRIRSVLTCRSEVGVCAHCYGSNLATGDAVNVGEAVGIIAAQSIGEPGTQLTMRTFHTGGVAGDDITQGLPRVEELFEARKPKGLAIISEIPGTVKMTDSKKKREVVITSEAGEAKSYQIPYGSRIKVYDGDVVEAGDELTEGSVNPHDILKIKGIKGVQAYLLQEVQRVYRMQGVDINDKHIEVIVRQMMRKVKIDDAGDTSMLPGGLVDLLEFEKENIKAESTGLRSATGERTLLGITKASLATDSFLSAASFQETTRVLTEAAIKGKVDPLVGLKENVIIGKLIPAGTGMSRYKDITINTVIE